MSRVNTVGKPIFYVRNFLSRSLALLINVDVADSEYIIRKFLEFNFQPFFEVFQLTFNQSYQKMVPTVLTLSMSLTVLEFKNFLSNEKHCRLKTGLVADWLIFDKTK